MTLGEQGEEIAEAYLRSRGYRILARNWSVSGRDGKNIGELDIIAKTPDGISVVEVKAGNSGHDAWRPEINFSDKKMQKVIRAGEIWLKQNGGLDQPWQVDLVAVDFTKDPPTVRHYCHTPEA